MKAIFFKILSHKHLDIILDQIGTMCGQKKTIYYNLTKNPPMILPVKNFSSGDSVNSVIHFLTNRVCSANFARKKSTFEHKSYLLQ